MLLNAVYTAQTRPGFGLPEGGRDSAAPLHAGTGGGLPPLPCDNRTWGAECALGVAASPRAALGWQLQRF